MCLRNLPNWACHRGARPASGLPHRGVLQTVWGVLFVLVSRRGDSGAKPQEPPTTRLQPGSGLHALPAAPSRKKGGTPSPHVTQPRTVSPRPPSRPPVESAGDSNPVAVRAQLETPLPQLLPHRRVVSGLDRGPSWWTWTASTEGKVGRRRVTPRYRSTFPSAPFRTGRAAFTASGSLVS